MELLLALSLFISQHRAELKELPQKMSEYHSEKIKIELVAKQKAVKKQTIKKTSSQKNVVRATTNQKTTKKVAVTGTSSIQCVQYVRNVTGITIKGNANTWYTQAKTKGYQTGAIPKVGAVLVENHLSKHGHVSKVVAVDGNKITVTEANYIKGKITTRTLVASTNSKFIYTQ